MPSRTFSTENRQKLASEDKALSDGAYPIPDKGALRRAIQSIGRAGPIGSDRYEKVKKHCIKRARELDAMELLPKAWLEDLRMSDIDISLEEVLEHFGTKGMRWGVRNKVNESTTSDENRKLSRNEKIGLGVAGGAALVGTVLAGRAAIKGVLKLTGNNKVSVLLPSWSMTDRAGKTTFGFEGGRIAKVKVKELSKLMKDPFSHL